MKKILFALFAMLSCISANADIFDGIDLNANRIQVMREISVKGYVYDEAKDCLTGKCQGTEIFLSFNLEDTKDKNKIGQLIIEVPTADFQNSALIFNVGYHQIAAGNNTFTYDVDPDGTTMVLEKTATGVKLIYNTPYYEKK